MPKVYDLEIAALLIRVSRKGGFAIQDGKDPAYHTFRKVLHREKTPDISLIVDTGRIPDTGSTGLLFDSNESWTMFRRGNLYSLDFHPPEFSRPFWRAVMKQSFTEVTVYCDGSLFKNPNGIGIANPVCYPLDQILLMHYLATRDGLIVHGAGIELKGKGYVFAGRSGAGKTTISKQFIARGLGLLLSDDRVIIRKTDDTFRVFGTPWPGEGGFAVNRGVPLGGIFFLARNSQNMIEEIPSLTTIENLLPVVSIPWYDPEPMSGILGFCDDLIAHIPSYMFHFMPDTGAVDMFEKFISQHVT